MILSGWGNYPRADVRLLRARGHREIVDAILGAESLIARGNGRAYGDAALNRDATLSLLPSDRILAFDPASGRLTCESGLLLADLIDVFLPRGWFPPVTPGTKFVTVGGMIAADVHGKNHHGAGTFGAHIEALDLALADGSVVRCSPGENADLFAATLGGMGLTGVILTATFRLMPVVSAYIRQSTARAANLGEAMTSLQGSLASRYSVAWIDCLASGRSLGRSLVFSGDHADRPAHFPAVPPPRRALSVPVDLPGFLLNSLSVRAFNALYYRNGKAGEAIIDADRFFYPLDAILGWNRIYGRSGFVQYQCVLPETAAAPGLERLLREIARSGEGSFLAVLKLMGESGVGMLSFPLKGYTLALDFRASRRNLALLTELDAITADHGGRPYLAKDARTDPAMLRFYPRLEAFKAVRRRVDPQGKFSSLQSQRLGL